MDFLKVLLDLKLLHLPLEQLLVLLGQLLIQSSLASLLSLLCIHTILILLLRFHYTLLSLLFFGLVVSSFFEFFELVLQELIVFDDDSIVEAGVGIVNVTH